MRRSIRSAALALALAVLCGCAGTPAKRGDVDAAEQARRFGPVFAYLQEGDFLRAEAELQKLAAVTPNDAQVHANLGIVYANTARYGEAVAALENATRLAPAAPSAFNELGIAYRKAGDFARSAAAYREAIRLQPGYANAHYNLGVLLDLYLRQPGAALTHYERYLALAAGEDKKVQAWVKDLRRRSAAGPTTASNDDEVERR